MLLLLLLSLLPCSLATYRILSLSDLCGQQQSQPSRVFLEDGGAAILSLAQVTAPYLHCDLQLRAGPGFGLMVQVEEARLRQSLVRERRCQDYLQLGRDDNTPFWTWDKTEQLCGEQAAGSTYDVPDGQLLVWVRLGGLAGLETASLSLVVTSYLREEKTNYRACIQGRRFIRRGFFCDGRVNCALDPGNSPADESVTVCSVSSPGLSSSTSPPLPGPPLNLLTITLVLVSATLLLLALTILAVKLGRYSHCYRHNSPYPELPELYAAPSHGLLRPQPRPHTLLVTATHPSPVLGTTPDTDSEPPPPYCQLFPAGYSAEEKMEVALETSTSQHQGEEQALNVPESQGEVLPCS